MKILFAIQGTGNGHLTRAMDIYPALCRYADVDVLVSGIQADIELPFPVKYRLYGMSFIFGKNGGINKWETLKRMRPGRLLKDILSLNLEGYDLVINDFEPVSAWACRLRNRPCISLSHQSAVLHPLAPKPTEDDWFGRQVLKYYAPATEAYGFHFKPLSKQIFTPVIRRQVREYIPVNGDHYTVYLPAYDDNQIIKELSVFENVKWEVFSKHTKESFEFKKITVRPIDNDAFINSMATGKGVLCGAGFETPAEALFLGKKLLVVPMKGQYEQQCNAACLAEMGIPVIDHLHKKNRSILAHWIDKGEIVVVNYPDQTDKVIIQLMNAFWADISRTIMWA